MDFITPEMQQMLSYKPETGLGGEAQQLAEEYYGQSIKPFMETIYPHYINPFGSGGLGHVLGIGGGGGGGQSDSERFQQEMSNLPSWYANWVSQEQARTSGIEQTSPMTTWDPYANMLSEAKQQQVAQYRSSVGEGGGGGGGGGYAASDMPQTSDATNRSSFATVYGAAPYSSDYSRDAYAQLADSSNYSRDAYAQVPNYSNPFA